MKFNLRKVINSMSICVGLIATSLVPSLALADGTEIGNGSPLALTSAVADGTEIGNGRPMILMSTLVDGTEIGNGSPLAFIS